MAVAISRVKCVNWHLAANINGKNNNWILKQAYSLLSSIKKLEKAFSMSLGHFTAMIVRFFAAICNLFSFRAACSEFKKPFDEGDIFAVCS